jgi:hypothetical protein
MPTSSAPHITHLPPRTRSTALAYARFLTTGDLPDLLSLESEKWNDVQAASPAELAHRLRTYPTLSVGAFCQETRTLFASLFMRPIEEDFYRHASTWDDCVGSQQPTRSHSLFGISLSSRHPSGVEALLAFFWPHALRGGWRKIYLGSPLPGFQSWRRRNANLPVEAYVALQRAGVPADPQLRYYHGRGFKEIVSVRPNYFPHEQSLDHGVILCGTVPLSQLKPIWRLLPLAATQRVTRCLAAML